ncbi:MAG TPA: PadR family transcriptional regulator [Actinotalea caeni]|uniref:PadR family transcriptional regulator n=1 Tax=Actinotalea caeni TaxID=1348467 RepID=UPI0012E1A03B|nr:PadR family transcriptional regulator [Actinotalea caeni]HLV55408.1 PadR family transcriptional regulator [Actinotalea caeni]
MRARSDVLELAILGQLQDAPLHGYELRKRLNATLGTVRALSYGSLYPALKSLTAAGLIEAVDTADLPHALAGKRTRIVYQLTAEGKERLAQTLGTADPDSWEDDSFGVRFSLFAEVDPQVRLRILEGRRMRMLERREAMREQMQRNRERRDAWTLELQRHGLEQIDREVGWLEDLITHERNTSSHPTSTPGAQDRRRTPKEH